ncbi:hypothetical protein D5F11_008850 [Siminovitchia terrae]|uniref:Uncharacterized protein n=1 Tax=Siminovitchia terrae TaxID=1914933 RepID=A0A429X9U6_SIMTE|nr:hypothetical protein [Siminovitchia terrae]RST60156.1 hypothetical protein D5F11_008850 [Siminovitchia terrae]
MENEVWDVGVTTFRESSVHDLTWLKKDELDVVNRLFEYQEISHLLKEPIEEQSAAELTMGIGTESESVVTMQALKFNKYTKLEIVTGLEFPVFARLYQLKKQQNGDFIVHLTVHHDGDIILDDQELTEADQLDIENIVEFMEASSSTVENDEVSTQAWYDKVPCMGNGCCVFNERIFPGGPYLPRKYNWCGAKCGGGCKNTPSTINALDACCKSHDCCYVRNKSYPGRCSCDRNLIKCAAGKSGYGAAAIVTAFTIKMRNKKC